MCGGATFSYGLAEGEDIGSIPVTATDCKKYLFLDTITETARCADATHSLR